MTETREDEMLEELLFYHEFSSGLVEHPNLQVVKHGDAITFC